MEIAPGIHQVPMLGSDVYLFTDERLTLIDAGMVGSRRVLERYLHRIGRRLNELDTIVCTHGHPDHIGGLRELIAGRPGVTVAMHPADIAGLAVTLREALDRTLQPTVRRGKLIDYLTPVPTELVPVQDGDVISAGEGLRVVHTPGHTPGSICLYAERHHILFTGDVLQVRRGRLTHASAFFSHDLTASRSSISKLLALDVEAIAFSHFPVWRDDPNRALRELALSPRPAGG
jgi:glyoxylase-like metal-dependent hydrolase (beta-lactamase superfamily II)